MKHRHHHRAVYGDGQVVRTDGFGLNDFFIGAALALFVFAVCRLWAYPCLPPGVWDAAATAAGIRPAEQVLAGFFVVIARPLFWLFGISGGACALRVAGSVALAGVTAVSYWVLRRFIWLVTRGRPANAPARPRIERVAAATGALAFAFGDPLWALGQCLTPQTIQLVLAAAAILFFVEFLSRGKLKWANLCAVALGLMTAETPFGLILTLLLVALNFLAIKFVSDLDSPFTRPAVIQVWRWHMTFLYAATLAVGAAVEFQTYAWGVAACPPEGGVASVGLRYLLAYWGVLAESLAGSAMVLMPAICGVPFFVVTVQFSRAVDEERFLPYWTGIAFIVSALIAAMQFVSVPAAWFWTRESSFGALAFGLFLCAMALAEFVLVLGVDALCRDHARIALQRYGADGDLDVRGVLVTRFGRTVRNLVVYGVPVLGLCSVLPGRVKTGTRERLAIIRDAVRATVDEASEARYLFTDGRLDAAIELEAAKRGLTELKCYPLVGGGANAKHLRTRGLEDDAADLFSFGFDAAMGLRGWMADDSPRLADTAVQVGAELWPHDGKPFPAVGGMVARPSAREAASGEALAAADGLVGRALAVADARRFGEAVDADVRGKFCDVLWCLSRLCGYRAEEMELRGDGLGAAKERARSRELDGCNGEFPKIHDLMLRRVAEMFSRLPPLKGLQLAIARGDFTMGKMYADVIAAADPENPDANFAIGMHHYENGRLAQAEEFLRRCLVRWPDDPAVHNNLAMICLGLGRLDEAELSVARALEIVPDSEAFRNTRLAIETARKAANRDSARGPAPSSD